MRARYNWVGNRILAEDMASLYKMKQSTRRPITALVAEAVSSYILSHKQDNAAKAREE